MAEKSILEQALLQVQTLEEAVKQNAKGILASTMKQELNDLLKESEEEEIEVSEETDMEIPEEETEDMSEQPEVDSEDDENDEDLDNEDSMDDEFSADEDSMDDDLDSFGDEDSMDDDLDSFGDEDSMDDDLDSFGDEDSMDDDVMDMTNASDDEVLRVFKSMKPEDGIVVKKDGNNVEMDVDGDEYIIKLDDGDDFESSDVDDMDSDDEVFEGDMSDDETIYEIELDEEEEMEEDSHEVKKIEATEAARTKSNPHGDKGPGQGRTGLKSKKMYKSGSGSLNEEIQTLKKQNSEYKKALVLFKEKLNEVAVFNANLAYATRLFTEHSTTKQEKLNILKRFDSVSKMNESKNLFSTIKGELENKKPITESVVNKITNTPTSSSSQEILSEAKAYENPQFKRMKELMSKIK
jgi:hypothetical protein